MGGLPPGPWRQPALTGPAVTSVIDDDTRGLAVALDPRQDGLDLVRARPLQQLGGGREAGDAVQVLDRREHEQQLARLAALQGARRLEPARVDDLGAVDLDLRVRGRLGEEEPGVEADRDL